MTAVIGGLYEVCTGVPDAAEAIALWEGFGYRVGPIGRLTAAEAKALYGVDSGLQSIRLLHRRRTTASFASWSGIGRSEPASTWRHCARAAVAGACTVQSTS